MGRTREEVAAGRAGSNRQRLVAFLLVVLCVFSTSCRPNKRYDLLEAELRTRERELMETRAALEQSRALNRVYDHERGAGVLPGARGATPTGHGSMIPMKDIQLARGTGGMDEDGIPGDETLMLVLLPRDEDGSGVKVPGRLSVAAWEISTTGIKTLIGTWDVPADKLRSLWRSGLISTGYFVPLPWQQFPTTEKVRVAVRFTTTDGHPFEADRDITVRLVSSVPPQPQPRQPLFPSAPPPGVPGVLPPGDELPPPAELMPERGAKLLPPVRP